MRQAVDSEPEPSGGLSGETPTRSEEVEGFVPTEMRKVEGRAKTATVWAWVIPAIVFAVVMLIFILQNFQNVEVSFISLHGRFPLALCLLFAAILGALTVAFMELARAVQIRRTGRRRKPPL